MRVGVAVLAVAGLCACAQPSVPSPQDLIARGGYLANNVAGCGDCHTPMTLQGPDMTRALQGADLPFAPTIAMPWAPSAPAIAGLPAHYSEDQFTHFLETGERPDGTRPLPPMPAYRFNAEDARALAAYVQSLPRAE